MIKFIGLTGPSGAGKSEAAKILTKMGFYHLDCDEIYHRLLVPPSPCLDEIRRHFGDEVFLSDGNLDRKALADVVFSADGPRELLPVLNAITHKYVLEEITKTAQEQSKNGFRVFVVDAPTLFESGFNKKCYKVISVLANKQTRIKRIIEREEFDDESRVTTRIEAQPKDEFYREKSDYIIYNDGDLASLEDQLKKITEEAEF